MDPRTARQKWDFRKLRTYWQDRSDHLWCFLCPFCSVPRRIAFQPRPGSFLHFFQVALTAFVFTLATWKWMGWKGIVSFVPFWTVFELIYRWRVRAELPCVQCGFDPYLYLIDVKLAREALDSHWRKKFSDKGIPFPQINLRPREQSPPNSS